MTDDERHRITWENAPLCWAAPERPTPSLDSPSFTPAALRDFEAAGPNESEPIPSTHDVCITYIDEAGVKRHRHVTLRTTDLSQSLEDVKRLYKAISVAVHDA
jgi:hypothetical protein